MAKGKRFARSKKTHASVCACLLAAALASVFSAPASAADCPNEAFRVGPSAGLPDCRAYELVSPPDSNGKLLEAISAFTLGELPDIFPTELGSPIRDSFVFTVYAGALSSPKGGSGVFDVYRAERQSHGWETDDHLSRTPTDLTWPLPGGVSRDHTYSFQDSGRSVSYLRDPQGAYELTGLGSLGSEPAAQGRYISEGGGHVIFSTGQSLWGNQSALCKPSCEVRQLEPNAPPTGTGAIYDRAADGKTHVISLLPSNEPPAAGEDAYYMGTSADGTAVAFCINSNKVQDPCSGGTLYVRVDNLKTEEVSSSDPAFAGISDDGSYLFYVSEGAIHRFETATANDVQVNPTGEAEVVNVSSDGSHVYFISEQQLDGGEGTAGEPNLYVWTGGSIDFIATVQDSDLEEIHYGKTGYPALANWTDGVFGDSGGESKGPGAEASRVTPDGTGLAFESRAQLTSYDNANPSACPSWVANGPDKKPDTPDDEIRNPDGRCTEIYRYDTDGPSLLCVSCDPTGAPATGDARFQHLRRVKASMVIHNLSSDGTSVFFETPEALAAKDINGSNDIYEWEQGVGTPQLISSGSVPDYQVPDGWDDPHTPEANVLLAVSPDGEDVFFTAKEALAPGAGENGTQAIFDARVNGGFPLSAAPKSCTEEGCRKSSGAPAPSFPGSGSESVTGAGNVTTKKRPCRHRRSGKGRKKGHCIRKRHRRANASASRPDQPLPATLSPPASGPASAAEGFGSEAPAKASAPAALAAGSEVDDFDIAELNADLSSSQAGAHPDFTTNFAFTTTDDGKDANASVEEVSVDLPPGLLGSVTAVPTCSMGDFGAFGNCSPDAQVGTARIRLGNPMYQTATEAIYNLTPPHPEQEVARLGLIGWFYPVFIDIKVRTASDYRVTATIHGAPGAGALISSKTTLWADPSDPVHDKERLSPYEVGCTGLPVCTPPSGGHPSTIPPELQKAFMTNPSACQPMEVGLQVKAYQLPGQIFSATAPMDAIGGCTGLPFAPAFSAEPTSRVAGAPTGLKTKLFLPQHEGPDERATATMREARVTLPEGMQVAAGAANWIDTCSDAQVGYHQEVDTACPDGAKLGIATFVSPAISTPIEGTIYQRSPRPGQQLGLWLTADALGLHIKLPGELEPDKATGRLTAVFRDLPQVPVSEIDLNVWGGPRAPLQNPDHCGTYNTDFSFKPHSDDPAATGQSQMQISEGCEQGFNPSLKAGVTNPVAGQYSPFVFDLTRPDGDQALRGFQLRLPDGELAKIAGVPLCSDADATAATCPAASAIGSLQATTGPGPDPLTIPQSGKPQPQIYLAGPYQGAPFSIVTQVPAQAGPFDLGTLAVRSGLDVEPETGQAVVKADPLPQFYEGVGIAYRHLHAVVDRPQFNINPTDCRETAVTAEVTSTQGAVAHPQARFQVDGCKALKFRPKLTLKLKGGSERADYPALIAVLKARKGDANIASTSVALPRSEFLAQEHINTICTRVQFAADKCPKGSIYGKAKAITPLLDKPLSGPVYLRSSDHPLPDLVAKLGGQLEIHLVGRIDSKNGGIRTTFESVPDAPVTKFVLQMRGGAKGLLTNSTDICRGSHRATVQMKAQNGRMASLRPPLIAGGCGKKKLGKHKKHH